ncbi:MAG: protoporphyrinogen oxidase HemJ [Pseudomonadota bacterium]
MRAAMAMVAFAGVAAFIFLVDPVDQYLWIKALHVIAVIAWMAGMVYLPRLFVYHADALPGGEADETFKVMERRLLKVIMTPAMIISWVLGLWLAYSGGHFSSGWFLLKFAAVVGMTVMHFYLAKSVKRFASGTNEISSSRWRALNEIPTGLMIAAVIFVIVKPFS